MLRLRLANRVRQAPGRRREVVERSEEAGVRHETPGQYPRSQDDGEKNRRATSRS
jgi:hypothetical protein